METRLIIKTHTACLRPAYYSLLILRCTSPNKTAYPATVARKLTEVLKQQGIWEEEEKREAAAKFAVLIAQKHLKLLRSNMTWDWRGTALAAVLRHSGKSEDTEPPDYKRLTLAERILFLKYLLEADGALISGLAEFVSEHGEVTNQMLYNHIEEIRSRIYEGYLSLAVGFRERARIKDRLREIRRQTRGQALQRSTLPHKALPHVQALVDLGVLTESDASGRYRPIWYGDRSSVRPLISFLNRLDELERLFTDGNPYSIIAAAYGLTPRMFSMETDWDEMKSTMATGYSLLRDSVTGTAYIPALVDWCCTMLLAEKNILVSASDADQAIDELHRRDPSTIRFHVDFRGNRSYVIMSRN